MNIDWKRMKTASAVMAEKRTSAKPVKDAARELAAQLADLQRRVELLEAGK